jgi:hypothetical protein
MAVRRIEELVVEIGLRGLLRFCEVTWTLKQTEKIYACVWVICKVCRTARALSLIIVTSCKTSLNTITNPNPINSHLSWHWPLCATIVSTLLKVWYISNRSRKVVLVTCINTVHNWISLKTFLIVTVKLTNKKVCLHGRNKISDILNGPLSEFPGLIPFHESNSFLL